jgi:hypothetical protein
MASTGSRVFCGLHRFGASASARRRWPGNQFMAQFFAHSGRKHDSGGFYLDSQGQPQYGMPQPTRFRCAPGRFPAPIGGLSGDLRNTV